MSKPYLPDLSDAQWLVLGLAADRDLHEVDNGELRKALDIPGRGECKLPSELGPYLEINPTSGFWRLTSLGFDVIRYRRRLLDPQTLADRLESISAGMKLLLSSGLNRRAVVTLLKDRCSSVTKGDIEAVLDALDVLAATYTTPRKGKPAGG